MKKYVQLTKFIDIFSKENFGEWFIDRENDGTREHPKQMPYVQYNGDVCNFIITYESQRI